MPDSSIIRNPEGYMERLHVCAECRKFFRRCDMGSNGTNYCKECNKEVKKNGY